ncbi:MAG TPA: GNAT family N-acetyltransferase [Urbifossiella sp.]|jgi:putative acetyltransferase
MVMQIRPLLQTDLDAVIALWQRTEGVGLNESDTPARLTAYLSRNPGQSFVARDPVTSEILGAVLCGNDGRRGYINHLAVAAKARRCGVGKSLVRACLEKQASLDILKCNVFVYAANTAGQEFWEKLGWFTRDDLLTMQIFTVGSP